MEIFIDDPANLLASAVDRIDPGIAEGLGVDELRSRCQAFLESLRETERADDATG